MISQRHISSILMKVICWILIFTAVSNIVKSQSQNVTANLLITPPYSVYFRDYAGYGRTNNMLLSLFSSSNRRVYLSGSVTKDDNSIVISVKNAYRPLTPILLSANSPIMLNGLQLRKIFGNGTTDDLNLTGLTANDIGLNQALPEGSYTFCIQVKDFDTREIISTACKTIFVTYYDPPQIIHPYNGVSVQGFTPQMLMVTWQNTAPQVFGITYRLKIVKLIKGITPLDAINNNVQLILDKGNLLTTNFPLDISSGIKLDTGQLYAMQVSAQSPFSYFKNNGKSEVSTFYYKGPNNIQHVRLDFLNPIAYKGRDTIQVSNDRPFMLSWNLFEGAIPTAGDTIHIIDTLNKRYGIVKYIVKVTPALNPTSNKLTDKTFKYTTTVNPDLNNNLPALLKYNEATAEKIGFKENNWYNATVSAYDKNDQLVVQNSSADFLYKKVTDDDLYLTTSVHALVKYSFRGFPELYNAINTPVQVEALQKVSGPTTKPVIKINNVDYISLAKASASSEKNGAVDVSVKISKKDIASDSIYYRVNLDGAYYIDKDFKLLSAKSPAKDLLVPYDTNYVNFGQLVAKTYGYSLKVNVRKAFTSYRIDSLSSGLDTKLARIDIGKDYQSTDSGMIYRVGMEKAVPGITMVLYRKTKNFYIPPIEGNLKSDADPQYGNVEIARGVTSISTDDTGHQTSTVVFDKLLSNIFNGDEYYIVALNPITEKQSIPPLSNNSGGNIIAFNHINQYFNKVYKDSGYIANESLFKLAKPLNIDSEDSLYRIVSTNYEITSTKPPTSLLKGRLLYSWKSDGSKQVRPLAKSTFKVVVDYLLDGKSIGYTTKVDKKDYVERFFVPQGSNDAAQGMQLLDFGKTMGTGVTDDQGNFELDVVNLNQKGSLGTGYVVDRGWSISTEKQLGTGLKGPGDIINKKIGVIFDPGIFGNSIYGIHSFGGATAIQQSVNQIASEQSFLNPGMSITMDNTGAFNIAMPANTSLNAGQLQSTGRQSSHGPSVSLSDVVNNNHAPDDQLVSFERVYRIVPDNPYIYPSMNTATVKPFEALSQTFNSLVKEVQVKVSTLDLKNYTLKVMKVIVFRSLGDKTKDLPYGEGDGKYLQKELLNPETAKDNNADLINAAALDKNNIFNIKYENMWPAADVNNDGQATFTTLLAGYKNYYVEAASDPENPGNFFKATFKSINTAIQGDNPAYWDGSASPDPINITLNLEPLTSRAFFRVLDKATSASISNGRIRIIKPNSVSSLYLPSKPTDSDGYCEIKVTDNELKNYVTKDGDSIQFYAFASGYNSSQIAGFKFNLNGTQFVNKFLLDPSAYITGHLVSADEKVKGYIKSPSGTFAFELNNVYKDVEGYIKTSSGKVYSTKQGRFTIPSPAIAGTAIQIIPKDVAYFDTSYAMTSVDASKKLAALNDIPVYRRKHRIHFIVTDADNGSTIDNATIQLENISKNTQNGIADFLFENVSINNYTFIIRGPDGKNYIPITKNIKNEETKGFVTVNISIEKGSEIAGKVSLDGVPVKHAKIYIDANVKPQPTSNTTKGTGLITNDANLLVAYTDDLGNYTLHGVPVNNQNIDVLATLDTSFAVNGARQKVDIINKSAKADFSLIGYRDLVVNSLYGFPLTVEKITSTSNADEIKVTGLIHWTKSVSKFTLNDINEVIRVEDITYKNIITPKGKIGVAQNTSVTLEGTPTIKLKYLDKYNIMLKGGSTLQPLIISNENDYGIINGKLQIVDNSFNYPSSYLSFNNNSFWLGEKNNGSITNTLKAVKSAINISEAISGKYNTIDALDKQISQLIANNTTVTPDASPDFYLSDSIGGNLQFSFIQFNANADAQNSFIDKAGKIHLNVSMNCSIKNAQPENFSVKVNEVILDENRVYPASSSSPIEVALEEWKLRISKWSISPEQGGIVSNDGIINTSKLDIPFQQFVLRSDMFDMDSFKLKNLQLGGGIVPLTVSEYSIANILFDNKTGSDMRPHWRFTLAGSALEPVAKIQGLPGINGDIGINYVQILSNNENIFQLQQTSTTLRINNNPLAKFSPLAIANGPDFFNIIGGLNVSAPRMSDMSLELNYSKQNGVLAMNIGNVKTEFEGKGFVHFTAIMKGNNINNITITDNQIAINGEVEEKPAKSFNPVPALFIATAGASPAFKVDLQKDYVMQLTTETNSSTTSGYKLTIAKGGMEVTSGDWSTLSYEGMMASNSTKDKGVKDTYTKFDVLGDVSVSADKVEMETPTPFGKLTMIFDFPAKRLIGKLDLNDVLLGTNRITGTVETLFDPAGFFVAGGGSAVINIGNPIADGTYNLGFMIGSYPLRSADDDLWKIVTAYKQPEVKNDCFVHKVGGKLVGFYMSVDRMIFDVDYDWDFIIVSGYVNGKALVGVDMWANFSENATLGVAVKVYAHAAAGMSAFTGTSISGEITALAAIKLAYEYNKFVVQGSIDMSFGVSIHQELFVTSISKSLNIGCSAKGGTEGFSFEITGGDKISACY